MPERWVKSDAGADGPAARTLVVPRTFELGDIKRGWLVFDCEHELVGRVDGSIDHYLIMARHLAWHLFFGRLYVPESALREAHLGSVVLNVAASWLDEMGWDQRPRQPQPSRHRV